MVSRLQAAMQRMHEPWGGVLCLDFANTLEPRGGPPPVAVPAGFTVRDELLSYDDLVAWAVHARALSVDAGAALMAAADASPVQAQGVLRRAHALRDAVYRVFWAITQRQPPPAADLAILAREHADGSAAATLVAAAEGVRWCWPADGADLARPLWPIAWSAAELLTTGDLTRVKVCPGTLRQPVACAWLFYDATRSRTRRWCSMRDCGGVAKAQRQTARRRAARGR
jgi:predicted RNA-binding Zn ribbon-like protein